MIVEPNRSMIGINIIQVNSRFLTVIVPSAGYSSENKRIFMAAEINVTSAPNSQNVCNVLVLHGIPIIVRYRNTSASTPCRYSGCANSFFSSHMHAADFTVTEREAWLQVQVFLPTVHRLLLRNIRNMAFISVT